MTQDYNEIHRSENENQTPRSISMETLNSFKVQLGKREAILR
jgi:hypothetical protein